MANIRQLTSGNWNAQVRLKGKPAQSKTFPTQEAAHQWAKQLEAVTKEHQTHTIYSLGMTYCESRLKGKGSDSGEHRADQPPDYRIAFLVKPSTSLSMHPARPTPHHNLMSVNF